MWVFRLWVSGEWVFRLGEWVSGEWVFRLCEWVSGEWVFRHCRLCVCVCVCIIIIIIIIIIIMNSASRCSWSFRHFFRLPTCTSSSLTPHSTVHLQKLTVLQLLKKFPAFCGTRRFITAFTSARHPSLSWAVFRSQWLRGLRILMLSVLWRHMPP